MVGSVAEISFWCCGSEHSLHPLAGLGDKYLVIKQVGQREQTVYPVGPALPGIPVAAYPGVVVTHYFGIHQVPLSSGTCGLTLQLVSQPALCLDGTKREGSIVASGKRLTVKHLRSGGKRQQER